MVFRVLCNAHFVWEGYTNILFLMRPHFGFVGITFNSQVVDNGVN